ncbi:signal transduction histidine kinase [Crossiella equi]|uniref:histidine kinase n=1 Tax=Crossiella equi TaxID=130796 RepID=A0ABS5AMF3_9PSEU|nr:histidine kinase [Crossiella equi]MBP2477452.1 signal transduction histidine kinase [Crossiella equi]
MATVRRGVSISWSGLGNRLAWDIVSARTWRNTLGLLLAPFWLVVPVGLILLAFTGALWPLVLLLVGAPLPLVFAFLPTVLLSPLVVLLGSRLLTWANRVEAGQFRVLHDAEVTPALRLPDRKGVLGKSLGLIVNPTLWRTIGYYLARAALAVPSGLLTFFAWFGPVYLIGVAVLESLHPPELRDAVSRYQATATGLAPFRGGDWLFWVVVFLVVGMVLLFLAPVLVRGMSIVHVALTRTVLEPKSAADLAARVREVEERRSVAMRAAEAERRRIERDLHDGAQQQLVALAMKLGRARARHGNDPDGAMTLVAEAHQEAKDAIEMLRSLTRGLHPPVLEDRGLDAALSALAAHCPVPVRISYDVSPRPTQTIEAIGYFVVAEALTNIAKHARASRAGVEVRREEDRLVIRVTDDGVGGAAATPGSGLAGLADRAGGVDGRLSISSPAGGPTAVTVELPCES